jgi:hypothetical protein
MIGRADNVRQPASGRLAARDSNSMPKNISFSTVSFFMLNSYA